MNKLMQVSRRKALKLASAATATGIVGLPSIAQTKPDQLVVADGGGALSDAYKKGYYDSFTAKTGIKIVIAPYAGVGKVKLMVESKHVDIDVIDIDGSEGAVAASKGYLEPIDWSLINRSTLIPNSTTDTGVMSVIAATVIAWNTNVFPTGKAPTTWQDVFNRQAFPGKRGLWKYATQTIEIALLADGVPAAQLYPLDVDRAFAKLQSIRDDIIWYDHGAQCVQLLSDGETNLTSAWNGRVYQPKIDGAPVDYTFNDCLLTFGYWAIPKGGRNITWAQEFIANTTDPKNEAKMAENIPYIGPAKTMTNFLAPDRLKVLPPTDATWQNVQFWAEHGAAIYDRFDKWMLG